MVLLDGPVSTGGAHGDDPRPAPSPTDASAHPGRFELQGLSLLRDRIDHFASWASGVSHSAPVQPDPAPPPTIGYEPTPQPGPEPVRSGVFGWRFKRH